MRFLILLFSVSISGLVPLCAQARVYSMENQYAASDFETLEDARLISYLQAREKLYDNIYADLKNSLQFVNAFQGNEYGVKQILEILYIPKVLNEKWEMQNYSLMLTISLSLDSVLTKVKEVMQNPFRKRILIGLQNASEDIGVEIGQVNLKILSEPIVSKRDALISANRRRVKLLTQLEEYFQWMSYGNNSVPERQDSYTRRENLVKAKQLCSRLLKTDSTFYFGYLALGNHFMDSQNIDSANILFVRSLRYNASDTTIFALIVQNYLQQEELSSAAEILERWRDNFAKDVRAITLLGNTYIQLNAFGKAEKVFKEGIVLEQNNEEFHCQLGYAYLRQKKVDEARRSLQKAIALRSNYAIALTYLGGTYAEIADHGNAIPYLEKANNTDSNNPMTLWYLGMAYNDAKRYTNAIGILRRSVSLDPKNANAYFELSRAYIAKSNADSAFEAAYAGQEIAPKDPDGYFYIGDVNQLNGSSSGAKKNYNEAISLINRSLRTDSKNHRHYLRLGDLYLRLGQSSRAIANYKRAAEFGNYRAADYLNEVGIKVRMR